MDSWTHSFLFPSRLLDALKEVDPTEKKSPIGTFQERFGRLVDLQGGMTLSKMLGSLSAPPFSPGAVPVDEILHAFLRGHREMVRSVAAGFNARTLPGKDRLPTAAEYHSYCRFTGVYALERSETPNNPAAAFNPFRKFYASRQLDLENRVRGLRSDVRGRIKGLTVEGARLAALDQGVEASLLVRTRQLFEILPQRLSKRFRRLLESHWPGLPLRPGAEDWALWMAEGGWLWRFSREMKELLLAEVEMRLLPVMGLVESIAGSSRQSIAYGNDWKKRG